MACLGPRAAVDVMHTNSGIKDKTAAFWIDQLLERAKSEQHTRIVNPETQDLRLKEKGTTVKEREAIRSVIKHEIQAEIFE